jgi:probable rRNA maturation factor
MHDIRVAGLDGSLPLDADEVTGWAAAVLDAESLDEATLSIAFLDADEMRTLNRRSLGQDRVTDVIAFRLEHPSGIAGDVYVCPSEAARNADAEAVPVRQELVRLVVHGVLHVLGHEHPDEATARTTSRMWTLQEEYVRALTGGPA